MHDNVNKSEYGGVEVEATFILPITIFCVVMLIYLSLFMFQKACLQSALETTLVYYKNVVTDNFVTKNTSVSYSGEDSTHVGDGNSYSATKALLPYLSLFGGGSELNNQADFEKYFHSIAGRMLFYNTLKLNVYYKNGLITDQFEAIAVQTMEFPIDLSLIGVGHSYEIYATARVAIADNDALIRDVDYAVDLIRASKLADYLDKFVENIKDAYGKFKSALGM